MSSIDEEPAHPVHLDELVELLVSTETIEDFLAGLTVSAADELAKFDGPVSCGITVRVARRGPATVGSSDALATALDESQYAARSGPCLEALDTGEVVVVTDAAVETRWPDYIAAAREQGMAASLSVPIPGPRVAAGATAVVGALNLYAREAREFSAEERDRAAGFAAQASGALAVAMRLAERTDLSENLQAALDSRRTIDQALGILMAQRQVNADDAFTVLRGLSQDTNIKLRHVAAFLIEHVSGEPPRPAPKVR